VLLLAGGDELAVGGDDVGRDQVVAGEAAWARRIENSWMAPTNACNGASTDIARLLAASMAPSDSRPCRTRLSPNQSKAKGARVDRPP
jgi:hypothetical protein